MKTDLIWLSLVSLPLAVVGWTAFASSDSLGLAASPTTAAAAPADLADSRLALTVVGPSGTRYHLVYAAGQGWEFVDLPPTTAVVKVKSSVDPAPPFTPTSREAHPQTLFIDGPTGYTFVWVPEGGWKFVGNIATPDRE